MTAKIKFLLLVLALFGCSKTEETPEPRDPVDPIPELYAEAADRAVRMLDQGWVICKSGAQAACQGDSLIFTGLALYALDCARARDIDVALRGMLERLDGGLWRHPDRPHAASLDGALGFYRGVGAYIKRCPGGRSAWGAPFAQHLAFLAGHDGLNPSGDGDLPLDFDVIPDAIAAELGLGPRVEQERINSIGFEIAAWADAVVFNKAAAYRIHLGLIAWQTLGSLGYEIGTIYRNRFCHVTREANLPSVDHWCGRPTSFIENFKFNEWEYRLQRAAWEPEPDGNGRETAGIDLLVFLRDAYQLPE